MKTSHKEVRRDNMTSVSRTQATREAELLVASGNGRSRWIATLIIVAILALGGWVIAQRVTPYAFNIGVGGVQSDEMISVGGVVAQPVAEKAVNIDSAGKVKLSHDGSSVSAVAVTSMMKEVSDDSGSTGHAVRKTAQLSITVPTVDDAVERISTLTRDAGGEVLQIYTRAPRTMRDSVVKSDVVRTTMTVRVPVAAFDQTLRAIKDLAAVVDTETVSSDDVTEEVADIAARLTNKRREEEAIAKILERSGKISDVLEVTRALSRVREEIERMEAQQRILRTQTDFSQIVVQLREDVKAIPQDTTWRPGAVARASLNRLVADMQDVMTRAIQFIVWFMPAFLLYVLVIVILWKILRRIGSAIVRKWARRQEKEELKNSKHIK